MKDSKKLRISYEIIKQTREIMPPIAEEMEMSVMYGGLVSLDQDIEEDMEVRT
jgi:hypothetical protein